MDGHDNAERDLEDTHKLLYTDLCENSSVLGMDCLPPKLDHCDLLLDAMDAQLEQLKVQPPNCDFSVTKEHDCSKAATLRWSQSLSKDTSIGSAVETYDTPMSSLDLMHTPTIKQISEKTAGCWEGPVTQRESKTRLDRSTSDKEEIESRKEQVIWRLERLLGDACKERKIADETQPPSESICTEDFVRRFREEMVELTLPDMQQLDSEEKAKWIEISDSSICVSGLIEPNVERQGSATTWGSQKNAVMAHSFQSGNPVQRKQQRSCLFKKCGVNMSIVSQEAGAEERDTTPLRPEDDGNDSHRTEVVTKPENLLHNHSSSSKAKCLAGVPVWSFDTVSVDSDLDTICSDQVRQHIQKLTGWCSLIQSVTDLNDHCTDQSGDDTPTQEDNKPLSTSGSSSSYRCLPNRRLSVHKAQDNGRETWSDDKDTDEDVNHWSGTSRPVRTSEKMQSDSTKMKERWFNLQQKSEKEEETLMLKRTPLKDAELCLFQLREKRKHALWQVEQLTAETTQMEKEISTLKSILRDSRDEKELVSCQLQKLQRQRESCLLEVRHIQEDLATLNRQKQTLKDGSLINRSRVIVSALEREELERQLDCAHTKLFAEQRCAREKIESLQEKLEETLEELHRFTEEESSLRNKCVCLEEKQIQKQEEIKTLELQVSKLQLEQGECKIRVGVLDKMLAQKEQQLLDLQETCGTLQTERDELKRALQHLKSQKHKELKEAQEQTHTMMIRKQAEEEKVNALKEETLLLMQHIDSLQSSIQLKEEELIKLRTYLQKEKEMAEKREEELHAKALEKVRKAAEEERRQCEAEKVEAVEKHCGTLEEQNRKSLESLMSEMEQEKSKSLALQHQVMELKTKIQELESESCAQQREQESLLAAICKSLKEEHQAELQRSQTHMAQQSQRKALQLERDVRLAVEESDRLRVMLEKRESSHKLFTAEMEQQLRHWTQQLQAECRHLHMLVEQRAEELPQSLTVAEAFTQIRTLREQLKHFISHLYQELDSQKQAKEQLRKDKERELSMQRQQLRIERDQALNSVKERLIQEHIEELSSLKWAHMSDGGGAEGGGVAASLRRQLKAKDLELRQVQRSMAQWKERTAARLACKFKEELTAELERKASKTQEVSPEGETKLSAKEDQKAVCSPCFRAVESHSPSNLASFKLLRYLQSRVKQLHVENQAFMWSSPQDIMPLDSSVYHSQSRRCWGSESV
ncbi:trichohyalin isoform X2 [Melanotaenia boesemani]|uniref:trichohyalin isoform X2 n=1 Tax=Melanotaenia boesemani TaxID=1250792 RepID=UPI001C04565F|nr:trichohyalin isoform X2 [Melanotaenia boesemani]